ncbi:helix-turn-helix domain-containing protein [Streptomyces sp. CC219B]|uniref:helix-turn-helix domain-containing protein n=1 Tax=Streptomyces sp. CC219B TaxID=3044574 RepID=UPI0024A8EC19|nr:helix-turn-helix domain-containing protein [Streptomyces sp. CC219B]
MDATNPGPLAPEVLERDDLRRALAEHDFSAAFSLIKKWGGLSQNRIAAACQLTPGKVSTIISGQQQVTSFDVICRIADGLRIPGRMVGLADRSWEAKPASPPVDPPPPDARDEPDETTWQPSATVHLAADLSRSDLVMDRRAATRALAAATTGAAFLDSLEAWLSPAPRGEHHRSHGRLGRHDVEELEACARAFRTYKIGGGLRRKAVIGQLNEVAAHLDEHQSTHIEQRLLRVLAQLSATAASMAWDAGSQRRAQDYYRLALRAAHAGDDPLFGANTLAAMARQMLYLDRPHDALELVHLAQHGIRRQASPRVGAMLATREAWAYAAMGRTSAFRRTTEEAAGHLADAGQDEPYWITYFGAAELNGVTGGRLLDLARHEPRQYADQAAESIRQALAVRGPEAGRSYVLDIIGLAECHFLVGDLTGAVTHTRQAVQAASTSRSRRVREQLAKLYPHTVGLTAKPVVEARTMIRNLLSEGALS